MTSMIDEVLDIKTERKGYESYEDDPDRSIGNRHEDECEQEQWQHQEAAEDAKTLVDTLRDRDDEVEIATQCRYREEDARGEDRDLYRKDLKVASQRSFLFFEHLLGRKRLPEGGEVEGDRTGERIRSAEGVIGAIPTKRVSTR